MSDTDTTNFKRTLSQLGFDWSNAPNGGQTMSSPMRLAYTGSNGMSPQDAWSRVQNSFNEYHVPYTGPVEITINGETHSYMYGGHTHAASQ